MEQHDIEEDEFGFSRNYLLAKELGNFGKKSGHKLAEIDVVDEQELREALANIEQKHEKEIDELIKSYKSSYQEWVCELRCGFELLMYGFGSKRTLLEDFTSTALTEYSIVVINGYLQSINLKQAPVSDREYNAMLPETASMIYLASKMISEGRGSELMPREANPDVPITAYRSYFPWPMNMYQSMLTRKHLLRGLQIMQSIGWCKKSLKLNGKTMPYPTEFRKLSRQ